MEFSDRELLDRFALGRDDAAFRALVERHLAVVHGVARRVTGNDDLARDVAQNSFLRLAQRAALIPRDLTLAAWLHRVTHHLAIDLVRSEDRRRKRELAAQDPTAMDTPPSPDWSALAPVIDTLINRLPAADRDVLLLRYYRNEPHAAVARQLGLTEAVAKKRAIRALEKLRGLLGKQGVATSAAVLATLLPAHAAAPVPGSLVLAVTAAAKSAVPLASSGFSIHLAMTTVQKSAIAAAALIFMASLGYAVLGSAPATGTPALSPAWAGAGETATAVIRTRPGRGSPSSAEERLERLRRILANGSPVDRPRQMLAFIDELALEQFAETAGQMLQLEVSVRMDVFRLLLGSWAKIDPRAAIAWARGNASGEAIDSVLTPWGEADPDAALDWVIRNMPEVTGHSSNQRRPLISVLAGIAAKDMPAAVEGLEAIPDEKDRIMATKELGAMMVGLRPGAMESLLDAVSEGAGAQRSALLSWSLNPLIRGGRAGRALELLQADEGAQKLTSIEDFFRMWHREDPAAALAEISKLPEGRVQDQAVAGICKATVNGNPPEVFALLRRYPGAATDKVVAEMSQDCPVKYLGTAAEQILQMGDPILRDEVLTGRLKWWNERDGAAARKWLETHEIPAAVRDALQGFPENSKSQ